MPTPTSSLASVKTASRSIVNREIYLNEATLKDIIAAHLYATTEVADDEEVLELHVLPSAIEGMCLINYKTIKIKEVELIVHS